MTQENLLREKYPMANTLKNKHAVDYKYGAATTGKNVAEYAMRRESRNWYP